ncbi:MAG: polymorphic toxin type 5 domain-containing protein [Bacteroidota bacterium]
MSPSFTQNMERARQVILAGGPNHPLRFLLDATGAWRGRRAGRSDVAVQAGHATSKFAGMTERFLLEDADYNQMFSTPERRHNVISRVGIEIGGVPVERETARFWQQAGYLKNVDIRSAPPTWGW